MNQKSIVAIVVAAVVVVAVGASAVFVLQKGNEDNNSYILIEDQSGVYFWTAGVGDTYADVITDINSKEKIFTADKTSWGTYVSAIAGLAEVPWSAGNPYSYWSLYYFDNGAWTSSNVGVDELKTSEHKYAAMFYVKCDASGNTVAGGPEKVTAPKDVDKVVYDGSTAGAVFTVTSNTGLVFKINGEGQSLEDAFIDACADYKIPFVASERDGVKNGIKSVFGLETKEVTPGNWVYWQQFYKDGSSWTMLPAFMSNCSTSDYSEVKILYGPYSA